MGAGSRDRQRAVLGRRSTARDVFWRLRGQQPVAAHIGAIANFSGAFELVARSVVGVDPRILQWDRPLRQLPGIALHSAHLDDHVAVCACAGPRQRDDDVGRRPRLRRDFGAADGHFRLVCAELADQRQQLLELVHTHVTDARREDGWIEQACPPRGLQLAAGRGVSVQALLRHVLENQVVRERPLRRGFLVRMLVGAEHPVHEIRPRLIRSARGQFL